MRMFLDEVEKDKWNQMDEIWTLNDATGIVYSELKMNKHDNSIVRWFFHDFLFFFRE